MYKNLSVDELSKLKLEFEKQYNDFKLKNLKLDMSRGKPCSEQLQISKDMFDIVNSKTEVKSDSGVDCLNYGGLDGIPECKKFFAELFEVPAKNVIIGGNSSLTMMFDYLTQCYIKGSGAEPWIKQGNVKFICPAPGYDRHFAILEYLGIEMLTVPMTSTGPDMDIVEKLAKDSSVKGLICVPKYSNPTGVTFSDETVKRLAKMQTADDFRIIWDNAYCVHHLLGEQDELLNIFDECEKVGNQDRVVMFASTSKVTFPGAGISALAASDNNISIIKERLTIQTIGPDKINQLRHVLYLKNMDNLSNHMKKCADFISPRFEVVLNALETELAPHGIASWEKPNGGYFISLDVMDGCANRVYNLCKDAGVKLTNCGATYPYGKDPFDRNIRIAPTYPTIDELQKAVELLCISVKLASVEKYLELADK